MSLTLACAKELGRCVCVCCVCVCAVNSYTVLFRHGIRCNALLPGLIETPMTATVPQKMMESVSNAS